MRIDNSHDVVSGADSDRSAIYIDRRIPQHSKRLKDKNGRPANLWKYLSVHETHEAKHMSRGVGYDQAHKIATAEERATVQRDGVSWPHYTQEINGYLSHIEHEKPKNPPPNDQHVAPRKADKRCYR